jgi:alkaline phosphatase/alkaline phosphatase D
MDDGSRPTPMHRLAPVVLDALLAAGARAQNIDGLFAAGSHRLMSDEEMAVRAGPSVVSRVSCRCFDCHDESMLVSVGTTERGTKVKLDRQAVEADLRVLIGTIEPHPQAGFGGGYKNLLPGLASGEGIGHNHLLMPSSDRYNMTGTLPQGNPMRLDLEEAGRLIDGPTMIVNVVLDTQLEPVAVVCGDAVEAHRRGVDVARQIYGVPVPKPADVVISGAYPMHDELRQAGKAVLNVTHACRRGGVIVGFMRCERRLGEVQLPAFVPRLSSVRAVMRLMGSRAIHLLARNLPDSVPPEARFIVNLALQMLKDYEVLIYSPRLKQDLQHLPVPLFDDQKALFAQAEKAADQADPEVAIFGQGAVSFPITGLEATDVQALQLRRSSIVVALIGLLVSAAACQPRRPLVRPVVPHDSSERMPVEVPAPSAHYQGEMAGEVTQHSVILQARLTVDGKVRRTDVKGRVGVAAFALATDDGFSDAFRTPWMLAVPEGDYIVKTKVGDLQPGTRYYYRLLAGPEADRLEAGDTGTFRTLDQSGVAREARLVVVTGMNQFAFEAMTLKDLAFGERALGFPGLEAIVARAPDLFVGTGDNVYYDTPFIRRASDPHSMRAKWHRQFATPRFAALFRQVPCYWEKDDHDYRYEDSDPHGPHEPSAKLAAAIFREQVPVVDPLDPHAVTYRTHRINDLLQIWLLEGRDYRDANIAPPGPGKTMWGVEQREWLKRTLLESDAAIKLLISPTPLVGPDDIAKGVQGGILAPYFGGRPLGQGDDMRKRDNHTNDLGFLDEGLAFFAWLGEEGFLDKNLYIVCGDRHWQYHAVHPSGFEEFSVGALLDANSRVGRKPGDPESTDPKGKIVQLYAQDEPSGGFLEITVLPGAAGAPARAQFTYFDEHGVQLYQAEKVAP